MKPSLKERNEQLEKELAEKNRELEIEAALESVRGRSLAMHASGELKEVANEMRNQLSLLGLKELETCAIHLYDISPGQVKAWAALRSPRTKGKIVQNEAFFPKKGIRIIEEAFEHYLSGEKDYVLMTTKAKVLEFIEGMKEHSPEAYAVVSKSLQENGEKNISGYWAVADFPGGSLIMVTMVPPDENSRSILRRFADVFGLAYRRFADLQKAEAQAREAQIEAALEKVRSRSLAMHKSDELKGVVFTLFQKLKEIGLEFDGGAAIHIFEAGTKNTQILVASPELETPIVNNLPYDEIEFINNSIINDIWKAKENGCDILNKYYSFEEKNKYFNYVFKYNDHTILPEKVREFIRNAQSYTATFIAEKNSLLGATSWTKQQFSKEDFVILKRFARVFEQAYIRFLDLQKAESQAREAQIEAALEKVRSTSLAMHHSEELILVLRSLFDRLVELGLSFDGAGIYLFDKAKRNIDLWVASRLTGPVKVNLPYDAEIEHNTINEDLWNTIETAADILNKSYSGKVKNDYFHYVGKYNKGNVSESIQKTMFEAESWTASFASGKNSMLVVDNWVGYLTTENDFKILKRFARVFEQAYTRFLDLQKAEAQARESQIEAALESVRASSMAMHHSNELENVVKTLAVKLTELGLSLDGALILFFDKEKGNMSLWIATYQLPAPIKVELPYDKDIQNNLIVRDLWAAFETGKGFINNSYSGKVKNDYFRFTVKNNLSKIPEPIKKFQQEAKTWTFSAVAGENSLLGVDSWHEKFITQQDYQVLIRFSNVFEQAHTRFLDLQKAEADAREAQIQLALERVRARTMAMYNSAELSEAATVLFEQLSQLGAMLWICGFCICNKDSEIVEKWVSPPDAKPMDPVYIPYTIESFEKHAYETWKNGGEIYSDHEEGIALQKGHEELLRHPSMQEVSNYLIEKDISLPTSINRYAASYKYGYLVIVTTEPFEETPIFTRFAKVFEQCYTRFLDLQKAEAQAREAQIEAALEKIRSKTLAMQKSEELPETSALIFQQLIALGIAPNRLYICIMQNDEGNSEFWITDENGSEVSMAYEDNLNNNSLFKKMYDGWKQEEKSLVLVMKGKELQNYFHYLSSIHIPFKDGPGQKRRWQYIAYFSKGFIGMVSPDEQPAESLQLLERFAYVFNLTFTRFNDLKIAEAHAIQAERDLIEIKAARKKAEDTLRELQATQRQLIQSEKMASLGELTTGIAHEIQNPLNFVNNFSEVNKELIEELNAERLKPKEERDEQLENEILNDLKENLEKINHHGKRADAIVKGMLQHSRQSSGQREPTDINALADEYLRLSYHGLRAKDKNFNATIETDFDNSLGKINVIPQDIGRVLLNLFNNAFYAVTEKKKQVVNEEKSGTSNLYQPTVSVSTRKSENSVFITVSDNGNGIPKNIVDKIFQPFFTTKPTGDGTGLGLSLSYDIIKAHGGEIKVESKEGKGSEFVIQLPS